MPMFTDLMARYRIDGGAWRQPRGYSYRMTASGIHHEWKIDPVSVNARTLAFSIMSKSDLSDPDEAHWGWTLDLKEGY